MTYISNHAKKKQFEIWELEDYAYPDKGNKILCISILLSLLRSYIKRKTRQLLSKTWASSFSNCFLISVSFPDSHDLHFYLFLLCWWDFYLFILPFLVGSPEHWSSQ